MVNVYHAPGRGFRVFASGRGLYTAGILFLFCPFVLFFPLQSFPFVVDET